MTAAVDESGGQIKPEQATWAKMVSKISLFIFRLIDYLSNKDCEFVIVISDNTRFRARSDRTGYIYDAIPL